MKKTSSKQKMKLQETLKDFKTLLPRYSEVQSSPRLLKSFLSRNRNPLWDITNTKAFSTGLVSNGYISRDEETKVSVEHYIQRSLAMRIIFDELSKNPEMSVREFTSILKRFCSTVKVTREEHKLISKMTKNTGIFNFRLYQQSGIEIQGLEDYLVKNNIK